MPTTSILAAIKQLKHFKTLVYAYNRIDCFAREAEYAQKHASEREHLHDKLSLHREWMLNLYYLREQYPIKLEEPITSYEAAIKEWVKLYKKWAVQCEEAQVLHDLGVEVLTDLTTHESLDFVEARLQCHIGRTKNAKAFEKRRVCSSFDIVFVQDGS